MPETTHISRSMSAMRRTLFTVVSWCHAVGTAWQSLLLRHERPIRASLIALWLGSVPVIAHAGIWNGGLCTVYQDVLDNELLEVVSLSALVGSIVLWLLDDGRSNIKTHVLRGVLGTLAILNMPLLWAQVFNHGAACTGTL
ncbi:hypothetical protein [Paraburkholderia rhynchosiae]|uniref:Uncharacterized protein n=1 Tax=Paraburkholderia rhynchosiae TaxID=487049 RepID=A0A2N7WWP6_9BURK|nr:hypothetical protein [Paraburkholderia rhynchosiae]PMS33800.1 hypothetical protein C0Z16_04565 [Paraburkholderia rhynchosiae]CAB3668476.1 hypothetical protein LMG27174_02019 [Paraburkholderia rhynchosiae]